MTLEFIANVIGTLAAAFAGAFFAFKFDKNQRKEEKVNNEVAAGNVALFALSVIHNTLWQYQKEIVEKYRDKPDSWLNLEASLSVEQENTSFNAEDLSFLLQSNAGTFQQVFLEGIRFRFAARSIDRHTQVVLSEVFPRLSGAALRIGEKRPSDEIEKILGAGIVQQLKILTAGIIKNVDENVISSRDAFVKLRASLKIIHPNGTFIDLPPSAQNGG